MGNRDPGTTLLTVDQWIKNHIVPNKQQLLTRPVSKKDLNDIFKTSFSSADQLYKTTGELFYHLQLSIEAMSKLLKENAELKRRDDQSSFFDDLKTDLESSIAEKFQQLSEKIDLRLQTESAIKTSAPSYKDILTNGKDNSEIAVFHLPDGDTSAVNPQEVFDKISQNLTDSDTQVDFMYLNKPKNKIVAGFPNKQERSKGQTANCQLTEEGCTIRTSEKLLPKLTVHNLPAEFFKGIDLTNSEARGKQKDKITEQIKKRNPGIAALTEQGHTLSVVYLHAVRFDRFYTVALKVSPSIRRYLLEKQGGRLFIGNQCFPFEDRFYLRVCYHCQQYGHLSDQCPKKSEEPICLYCSQRHASKTCPFKKDRSKYSCHRCSESPNKDISAAAYGHTANDPACPVTQGEIEKLKSKTDFVSKNVM